MRQRKFETVFNGDKVTVHFKPIEQLDRNQVAGWLKRARTAAELPESEAQIAAAEVCSELVNHCVKSIEGLGYADGVSVTVAEIAELACFTELTLRIGKALIDAGFATGSGPQRRRRH